MANVLNANGATTDLIPISSLGSSPYYTFCWTGIEEGRLLNVASQLPLTIPALIKDILTKEHKQHLFVRPMNRYYGMTNDEILDSLVAIRYERTSELPHEGGLVIDIRRNELPERDILKCSIALRTPEITMLKSWILLCLTSLEEVLRERRIRAEAVSTRTVKCREWEDDGTVTETEYAVTPNVQRLPDGWYPSTLTGFRHGKNSYGGDMTTALFKVKDRVIPVFMSYLNPHNRDAEEIADKELDAIFCATRVDGDDIDDLVGKKLDVWVVRSTDKKRPLSNSIKNFRYLTQHGETS